MKRALPALALLLASGSALADDCASASTQADINACAANQYQAADKKLNSSVPSPLSANY